ncbi:MAG TPA: hypothetical protein VJU78_16740 [Chitinophagaceae bacterium]|nr:hypothetical protein [Chitinophagaceae bacterium]
MKFVAVPILILLIMTQVFSKWFVVLSFKLNQDYIAKNICENRYRPKFNCNGNCVLMKKLKQEEKKEQNTPATLKLEITSIILSSKSFFATAEAPVIVFTASSKLAENSGKPVDRTTDIFHPPAA